MAMRIESLDYVEGAHAARGVVIVIDVFRACSVVCQAFAQGAARILPFADAGEALRWQQGQPEVLSIGERHGRKLAGFDYGNSPTDISQLDLRGRTLVHTTHAGTQGLVAAQASQAVQAVLTGALANAAALCRYVIQLAPSEVSLVRMGVAGVARSDADDVCAELLTARLQGLPAPDQATIRERLRRSPEAQKFFDPLATWAPEGDFQRCTGLDRFDFVARMCAAPGPAFLERVDVPI
jgi:2-phosphosulfolactate phosphatase